MTENSEMLAQQARSAGTKSAGPTIELVTPGARLDGGPIICPPNCIPNCLPVCPPNHVYQSLSYARHLVSQDRLDYPFRQNRTRKT